MEMLVNIFLEPATYYFVISGYLLYTIFHQYQIDRVLRDGNVVLGFLDKLLLFRFPFWRTHSDLDERAKKRAKQLAHQYTLISFLVLLFFATAFIIG